MSVGTPWTYWYSEFAPLEPLPLVTTTLAEPEEFAGVVQVIAVALTIFLSSFASRFATLRQSLLLAAGFTVFCVVVFHFLLRLPIPLWGTLITG